MEVTNNKVSNGQSQSETPVTRKSKSSFLNKLIKILDYALKGLIYLTIFGLPLVFSTQSYDVLSLPKLSFLAIAVLISLMLWLIRMVISRDFKMRRTPLDLPILIFGAIYFITSLISISPLTSIVGSYGSLDGSFITVILFIILYYLIVNNLCTK